MNNLIHFFKENEPQKASFYPKIGKKWCFFIDYLKKIWLQLKK